MTTVEWHVGPELWERYVAGSLDFPTQSAVDTHVRDAPNASWLRPRTPMREPSLAPGRGSRCRWRDRRFRGGGQEWSGPGSPAATWRSFAHRRVSIGRGSQRSRPHSCVRS